MRLSGKAVLRMSTSSVISCQSIDIDSFEGSPEALVIFRKVSEALRTGKRIVVVTGAGISVSSGIPVQFKTKLLIINS